MNLTFKRNGISQTVQFDGGVDSPKSIAKAALGITNALISNGIRDDEFESIDLGSMKIDGGVLGIASAIFTNANKIINREEEEIINKYEIADSQPMDDEEEEEKMKLFTKRISIDISDLRRSDDIGDYINDIIADSIECLDIDYTDYEFEVDYDSIDSYSVDVEITGPQKLIDYIEDNYC